MGTFRETFPAAKSEEKRTFSQAKCAKENLDFKNLLKKYPSVYVQTFSEEVLVEMCSFSPHNKTF